jgi:hypothetical protein
MADFHESNAEHLANILNLLIKKSSINRNTKLEMTLKYFPT